MRLSKWAKINGLKYDTAWRQYKKGLIDGAYQLKTGTIIVPDEVVAKPMKVAVYARVSSSGQKKDLERQAERVILFCNAKGWSVDVVQKEIASGLNDQRKKLNKLLTDTSITHIVIEHKDRLTRFGFNYIKSLMELSDRRVVVINNVEGSKKDLMDDFVSIVTSFCARIYGNRRSARKKEQILEVIKQ